MTQKTVGVDGDKQRIAVEGEYRDSDPEVLFRLVIEPQLGYMITHLQEFDRDGRLLTDVTLLDPSSVAVGSTTLWLPSETRVKQYRYDHYEGNTVQAVQIRVLEPRAVPVDQSTFSLAFPAGAKVYDATVGAYVSDLMQEARDAVAIEVDAETPSTQFAYRDADAIIAKAEALSRSQVAVDTAGETGTIRFPQPMFRSRLCFLFYSIAPLFVCIVAGSFFYRTRRKRRRQK